jgi:hypothetical protein
MKKLAYVGGVAVAALLATTGLFSTQAYAKDEKAAAPAAADKKAAASPAAAPAATPATKPEAAKPAAGAPAPKMEPVKPAEAKPAEPAKMEPPKPPAEVDGLYKTLQGTWKCTGTASMEAGVTAPMEYTISFKLDLDKFWIVANMASKKTKQMPAAFKFTSYTTYDAATKKWNRVMVDNMGGFETNTSAGLTNGQVLWEGKATGMGMSYTTKHTEMVTSPKEVKMSGQMSVDGKNWMPMYDATCKK